MRAARSKLDTLLALLNSAAQEAIAEYEHALSLRPDFAPAHYNLANALAAIGGVLVVIGHAYSGILDAGHLRLRLVGEASIFAIYSLILCLCLCLPALVVTRGRSSFSSS